MAENSYMSDMMNAQGIAGLYGPNPYLQYTGQIPMAGYRGAPTDAAGNPIASFTQAQQAHDAWNAANPAPTAAPAAQGTTLNSNPYGSMFGALSGPSPGGPSTQAQYAYNQGLGGVNPGSAQGRAIAAGTETAAQPHIPTNIGGQQAAPAAAPTNPIDMRQAYLDALSNPGKVTTPGAQMQPGTTPTGPSSQPSVLQQFLSQHPEGGQTGGGGYSNQGFFSTLNALKQGGSS